MKTLPLALLLAAMGAMPVLAQTQPADPTTAYIDTAFKSMDKTGDGQIDRVEFDHFMRARMDRQRVAFDADFAKLDVNSDQKISLKEAAAHPPLAKYFKAVDADGDGSLTKAELRAAMIAAQAAEVTDQ
jgi:Ca2+-binding EF-hand superfamily protein